MTFGWSVHICMPGGRSQMQVAGLLYRAVYSQNKHNKPGNVLLEQTFRKVAGKQIRSAGVTISTDNLVLHFAAKLNKRNKSSSF